jgi:DNA polymerase III epsilon subunit-like protein
MIAVVDIETSSTDYWRGEIIALSIGLYSNDGQLVNELDLKFRPVRLRYWDKGSEAVHKITVEEAKGFPNANQSWAAFFDFLEQNLPSKVPFVCHALYFGSYFDRAFINCQMFLSDNHWLVYKYFSETISTHTMCQKLKTHGVHAFEKLSLDYLSNYFRIKLSHHDARSDREACAKIYFKTKDQYDAIREEQRRKEAAREADQGPQDGPHRALPPKVHRGKRGKLTEVG